MITEIAEANVPVSEQAAAWFLELSNGPNNRATRQRFVRWLKRSPQHIDSFLAIAVLEQELSDRPGSVEDAMAVIHRPGPGAIPIGEGTAEAAKPDGNPGRRRHNSGWLAAAALTAVTVLGSLPFLLPPDAPPSFVHKTDFGEQRSIALGDGSIVVLNTVSEIAVHYDADVRRVELLSGEALFDVASDTRRPFVVETGSVALKVLGTRFSVYHTPEATRLAVVEGVVRAISRQQPGEILVHAGEGAIATDQGVIHRKDGIDVDKAIAWTERRLIFEKAPLADVVSEFNRYNRKPLIVQDPQLAERRITSVFLANDVSALVAFLELEPDIEVDYGADAIRIRRKP